MEDYVTFEQAVKLRELGFDWECFFPYTDGKIIINHPCPINWNNHGYTGYELISAPTLCQVQKWLREVKEIFVYSQITRQPELKGKHYWEITSKNGETLDCIPYGKLFDTYEQALSAGIDNALELLK